MKFVSIPHPISSIRSEKISNGLKKMSLGKETAPLSGLIYQTSPTESSLINFAHIDPMKSR